MFKNGFGINNLEWLMWHKTKQNQTKPELFEIELFLTLKQYYAKLNYSK